MSSFENQITLVGNLTRDPELRFTTGGTAVCNFGVAYTPRRRNANGEWEDGDTSFFNVSVWRELGENAAATLVKGSRVVIVGSIAVRPWTDNDGKERISVEITADAIGPDLKWATAEVERTSRSKTSGGGKQGPPPQEPAYTDEEPF